MYIYIYIYIDIYIYIPKKYKDVFLFSSEKIFSIKLWIFQFDLKNLIRNYDASGNYEKQRFEFIMVF